jgi:hypothetical protein
MRSRRNHIAQIDDESTAAFIERIFERRLQSASVGTSRIELEVHAMKSMLRTDWVARSRRTSLYRDDEKSSLRGLKRT